MNDEIFHIENEIDVDRLARLARFTLTDEERASLTAELKKMADYTYPRVISEDIALPFSYVQAKNAVRDDVIKESTEEERRIILSNCPSLSERYFTVPKVIKEEEE